MENGDKEKIVMVLGGKVVISFRTGRGKGISRKHPHLKLRHSSSRPFYVPCWCWASQATASYLILSQSYFNIMVSQMGKVRFQGSKRSQCIKKVVESGLHLVPGSPGNVTEHFS